MKKTILFVLTVVTLSFAFFFHAQETACADNNKRISAIKVEGNEAVSTATIINRLKIKPGDVFQESAVNNEIKRLYATGYFTDVFAETEDLPEGIVVRFTVVEKPVISAVEFRGNARVKEKRLQKKIKVKEGVLLDYHVISEDVAELTNYYIDLGYSRVQIEYSVETDPETGLAVVVFNIDEGYPLKIRSIDVVGNKNFTDKEIKKYMATKTAFFFLRKGAFNNDTLDADLERIRMFMRSNGFLDAQVSSQMDYSANGEDIYITVVVDEGKKYLAGETTIKGDLAFSEMDIRRVLSIRPGDPFDYALIRADRENLLELYYDKGYMDAEVNMRHKYNPDTGRMDLNYTINSNNQMYVGKVNVIGNVRTKDQVVRREVRVYPGERYDGKKLKKSKERIYNLGFFEDVYFETVHTDDPNVKDLNITIKETKTGELSFGGGYSSVDAFIGFAQIRQKNFDITNFPTFSGGGQDLSIRAELGSNRTNYYLSWTDPWIFGYPLLFGSTLYRQEYSKNEDSGYDYDEMRMGGSMQLAKSITDSLSTGLVYNLEEVKISNIPDDASQDFKDESGSNYLSRLTWNTQFDTRDNKFSPKKGIVLGFTLENAGGFIGGDKDFFMTEGSGTFYHTFFDIFVLELKGRAGVIKEYGKTKKVPIYERFFAGGANSIRGYKQRAVGPRDPDDKNLAIGGRARIIGNIEVTFPIIKKLLKGAVFYDVGAVHEDVQDFYKADNYKAGAGIGVRIKTPIGPIKLDYGFPLNKNGDDKQEPQFYFSVSHGF